MPSENELYNEAEKLKDSGKFAEAIAKLEEILASNANHALAHLSLAVLCGKVGRHEAGVEHARRACELEPGESINFATLSVVCQRAWAGTQNQAYIRLAEDARDRANMLQGGHRH